MTATLAKLYQADPVGTLASLPNDHGWSMPATWETAIAQSIVQFTNRGLLS